MRLFIAIKFDEKTKNTITDIQGFLSDNSEKLKLSLRENLHLTLVFLGEIQPQKIASIKSVMKDIDVGSFEINFGDVGFFKRYRSDIAFIKVKASNSLMNLQKNLSKMLSKEGFVIEERRYTPHVTLARDVILKKDADLQLKTGFKTRVDKISLMKSEHIGGKLTYTEIL